ncbi:hypothetical protein BpHYR1_013873 [Brachionus plicatilis]|uniref:Uncharacterized protein n=1 Tax=Brachionus plicatilis TaxID=10195 RepID=A0A3M7SB01_BRAPC|nr:hypothetical protein BpHYR1_013873 [Brachionus plicatilis]
MRGEGKTVFGSDSIKNNLANLTGKFRNINKQRTKESLLLTLPWYGFYVWYGLASTLDKVFWYGADLAGSSQFSGF